MTTPPPRDELPTFTIGPRSCRGMLRDYYPGWFHDSPMTAEHLSALLSALDPAVRSRVLEPYMPKKERRFPVLHDGKFPSPRSVPWSMVAPQEAQARANHEQSLERLAERGGLGQAELVAVLRGERWRERTFKTDEDAVGELVRLLGAHDGATAALAVARAEVERLKAEVSRLNKKWQDYENGYILPCFKWAEECGIDLPALVAEARGNCVERLVGELRRRIRELEGKS